MDKWDKFLEDFVDDDIGNEELERKYTEVGIIPRRKDGYRPELLKDFIGQHVAVADLQVHIASAKKREKAVDHIAFFGPPGLGKTTLARIIASEMESDFRELTGHSVDTKKLESILLYLKKGDVLFVDEIHAIKLRIAEMLYSPMQDFQYEGIQIPEFTLVGATTNLGKLPKPMIDRIVHRYDFTLYSIEELINILVQYGVTKAVAKYIAQRSKGVPRHAAQFIRKIEGYVDKHEAEKITVPHCREAFKALQIDVYGLGRMDRIFLKFLDDHKAITPRSAIGLKAIVASLNLTEDIYANMIEPHLLSEGFIKRTPRGRILTPKGVKYVGAIR
jgi:Holliday junction DNA helicase RuvB